MEKISDSQRTPFYPYYTILQLNTMINLHFKKHPPSCDLKWLLLFLFFISGNRDECNLDQDQELQRIYASDSADLSAFQMITVGSTSVFRQALTRRKIRRLMMGNKKGKRNARVIDGG